MYLVTDDGLNGLAIRCSFPRLVILESGETSLILFPCRICSVASSRSVEYIDLLSDMLTSLRIALSKFSSMKETI